MILVFGKTGQVAQELQKFNGVLALDRTRADLTDLSACAKAIFNYKPRAVINAAAYTAVDMAEDEEDLANLINGEAPGAMAIVCADLNIPLVNISTDYVFDGSGEKAWDTFDLTNPQNAYGRSKLKGERAIKASGADYAILRTSWVVSAHGNNFLKNMLRLSESQESLNVVDDQIGGPTPAQDIARACMEIVQQLINEPKKSGIYHFSGRPDVSWCQFANTIFKQADRKTFARPILTSEYPTPALRPINSRLDCSLTESIFNITRPSWRQGLRGILRDLEIIDVKT